MRRRPHGFSLFELIAVLSLIGIAVFFVIDRMLTYVEYAEKVAMDTNVAVMKRALAVRAASYLVQGRLDRVAALGRENPIDWLADPPGGYIGVLSAPAGDDVPGGSWYFDEVSRELAYRPKSTRFFQVAAGEAPEIRFRAVVIVHDGRDGLPREVSKIAFEPARPYRWDALPPG